ncbi:MAG: polymer-forming cytoskeletal protein [Thermodesulfobacteriota bacterium]|nr:polymer-forming cytoskeletal protein [Thermodesulfobacteriota bacterium]
MFKALGYKLNKIFDAFTGNFRIAFKRPSKTGAITIIGEGNEILGRLVLKDKLVRIDGKIKGDVISEGWLSIGKNGKIEGEIHTKIIVIHGKVQGTVYADKMIHIKARGELYADIFTSEFIVEEGGFFEGNCRKVL